jgi:hypothetical protein
MAMCGLDMAIYIQRFHVLNRVLSMHLTRIAKTRQILFLICWLMKEQPLVGVRGVPLPYI